MRTGCAVRKFLLALIALPVLGAALLVLWVISSPTFVTDRSFWAWNGWAGIAAVGTFVAASATLGTLIFFGIQLAMLRSQARREAQEHRVDIDRETQQRRETADFEAKIRHEAIDREARIRQEATELERRRRREDYEYENTPILAILANNADPPSNRGGMLVANCELVATGQGIAFNVIVNFWVGPVKPANLPSTQFFPSIEAPGTYPLSLNWPVSEERQWITINLRFMSMFHKAISYEQTGYVETTGLVTTEPPRFMEGSAPGPAV